MQNYLDLLLICKRYCYVSPKLKRAIIFSTTLTPGDVVLSIVTFFNLFIMYKMNTKMIFCSFKSVIWSSTMFKL